MPAAKQASELCAKNAIMPCKGLARCCMAALHLQGRLLGLR